MQDADCQRKLCVPQVSMLPLISYQSTSFWIIAHAIRDFHARHGVLPLPGAVPDMKAQSADYIQLQNIYKAKARKDLLEIVDKVRSTESELMKDKYIDEREVEAFCKGAASVRLIQGRPLKSPTRLFIHDPGDKAQAKNLAQELNDETSLFPIYLSFLAHDLWADREDKIPWSSSDQDLSVFFLGALAYNFKTLLRQSGIEFDLDAVSNRMQKYSQEISRALGGELHNISALTGGMVAQEVIKVITKQYIPFDNTCVFDGIASKVGVFRV